MPVARRAPGQLNMRPRGLDISACCISGTKAISIPYLEFLLQEMLDLVALEHWPGFVRQADLCAAALH